MSQSPRLCVTLATVVITAEIRKTESYKCKISKNDNYIEKKRKEEHRFNCYYRNIKEIK